MMNRAIAISGAAYVFGAVLAPVAGQASPASPASSVAAAADYHATIRKLERAFESRNPDEAMLRSLYTANSVLVESSGAMFRDRDSIVRHFKQILASGAVKHFKVETTSFQGDGLIGYAGGYELIEQRDQHGMHSGRQQFLAVLRRQPGGPWQFAYVMEAPVVSTRPAR